MRTACALIVMPRSRSRSMESSTCACISRALSEPVSSSSRSAKVDFPWSMCAMIAKLRMEAASMKCVLILDSNRASDLGPQRKSAISDTILRKVRGGTSMRKLPVVALFTVCTCFNWAQSVSPQVQPFIKVNAPVVALTHVRVIAGTGEAALEDQTIVISKGKIQHVTNASAANVPSDAQVLDLHGYSVIPGLVGMHDHMFYPMGNVIFGEMGFSFPRLYLAGGVTTIRTTGSLEPYTDLELKKAIDAHKIPGPKMHVAGPYLEGAGSWALQLHQLTGPEDATKTVDYWLDEGVDNFKAYMFITPAELSAAIAAAHKRGAKVTGHLCSIGFREAAELGIDNLEHGLLVDTEFLPGKKPGLCPDEPENPDLICKVEVK